MTKGKCIHESIYVEEIEDDMIGVCDNCGEIVNINHIKNGLYTIEYEGKIYLLNTIKDMNLENNPYQFEINENNICLHKNVIEDYKSGSARQLCKKMKK